MNQDLSKVYIVLPKYSSYEFKDITQQVFYQSQVLKWVDKLKELNVEIYCFAEDVLALSLLKDTEGIKWISALGLADTRFVSRTSGYFPKEYGEIEKISAAQDYIKRSVRKIKMKDEKDFDSTEQYESYRISVINSRIRLVADDTLSTSNVVYFNANNNFCTEPSFTIGDGRFIVNINVAKNIETFAYGGMLLTEEHFCQILRGAYGK